MTKKIALELKNISYAIGGNTIFQDLNTTIYHNDIVSILGYNGAGKSTLLKIILGSIVPTNGKVVFVEKTRIGYVPQKLSFDRKLPISVRDFLEIYTSGDKIQTGPKMLLQSIETLIGKHLSALSGGQLQKVLIYNALIGNPSLLLLDEPTSGLDIHAQREFYTMLEEIHSLLGCTIVIVSHDIHTVYSRSDQVICLHKGDSYIGKPHEEHLHCNMQDFFGSYVSPYIHHHHDK